MTNQPNLVNHIKKMGIRYEKAWDIQEKINEIALLLFPHVKLHSVVCLRSFGSTSRGTIARCHALGKAMQIALDRKGFYLIEVIHERFDKLSEIDKTKTLIHELMHIPKGFGGGFIFHNQVNDRNVNNIYEQYVNLKKKDSPINSRIIFSEDKIPEKQQSLFEDKTKKRKLFDFW
jgi:predicted metallopeptidase